jgi:hypothetical protein
MRAAVVHAAWQTRLVFQRLCPPAEVFFAELFLPSLFNKYTAVVPDLLRYCITGTGIENLYFWILQLLVVLASVTEVPRYRSIRDTQVHSEAKERGTALTNIL